MKCLTPFLTSLLQLESLIGAIFCSFLIFWSYFEVQYGLLFSVSKLPNTFYCLHLLGIYIILGLYFNNKSFKKFVNLYLLISLSNFFCLILYRVKGKKYFDCLPQHGLLLRPDKVKVLVLLDLQYFTYNQRSFSALLKKLI